MKSPPSAVANQVREPRVRFGVDQRYRTPAWTWLSKVMRALNPVCQRLHLDGYGKLEQCRNPSGLVHHIISPKQDPSLFLVPSNLICLCEHDHDDSEGTPDWVAGVDFVETILPKGSK
jgi:hypothetical protein